MLVFILVWLLLIPPPLWQRPGIYGPGPRFILELRPFLSDTFKEEIKDCHLCKDPVIRVSVSTLCCKLIIILCKFFVSFSCVSFFPFHVSLSLTGPKLWNGWLQCATSSTVCSQTGPGAWLTEVSQVSHRVASRDSWSWVDGGRATIRGWKHARVQTISSTLLLLRAGQASVLIQWDSWD